MGCFIISRTPSGDRFMLQSDAGRTLITSKDYATLDACKKGICSLVYYAPIVPVVDGSAGEYGPNPKFEITANEQGELFYVMKSANGKSVVEDGPFATKKACLRAIAMLRAGVVDSDVFFARPGGFDRLTVGNLVQDGAAKPHTYETMTPVEQTAEQPSALRETVEVAAEVQAPDAAFAPETVHSEGVPTVRVPHRIPTTQISAARPTAKPVARKEREKPPVSKSLFSRLFKK